MQKLNLSNSVNLVMQAKGGAGKSVVSFLLGNYLKDRSSNVELVDTDPSNQTFSSYKALDVKTIDIIKKVGRERMIDQSKFDEFIESFAESSGVGLVDTGSGDFIYINSYLLSNEIPEMFAEIEKQLVIHVPVDYGSSKLETADCLIQLCKNYPNTPIVIWGNEYQAPAQTPTDIKAMNKATGGNIIGTVKIEKRNVDTYEADFRKMLTNGLIFNEVKDSEDFSFLKTRRLMTIKNDIYDQLDSLFCFDDANAEIVATE